MKFEFPPRIRFAQIPTPLHKLEEISKKLGPEIWVKRDDLTGCAMSGNKIRKLEFLLYDAKSKGADTIITCGAIQSNHARATALAATKLKMKTYLILYSEHPKEKPLLTGNFFLDKLLGAKFHFITTQDWKHREQIIKELEQRLRKENLNPYSFPEGGSTEVGVWGYINAAFEIKEQIKNNLFFDTIIYACGSGGTGAGLHIGKMLTNLKSRLVGFSVCEPKAYFKNKITKLIQMTKERYQLDIDIPSDIEIEDRYIGIGYGKSQIQELRTILNLAREEGIILDPVYTGKAFHGLLQELQKDKTKFGERILFIHTGGIFGLLAEAGKFEELLGGKN